jgi:hypothetical protein
MTISARIHFGGARELEAQVRQAGSLAGELVDEDLVQIRNPHNRLTNDN